MAASSCSASRSEGGVPKQTSTCSTVLDSSGESRLCTWLGSGSVSGAGVRVRGWGQGWVALGVRVAFGC